MDKYGKVSVQVWVLRIKDSTRPVPFVAYIDDDCTEGFMAWATEEQARDGLDYQIGQGYLDAGDAEVFRLY